MNRRYETQLALDKAQDCLEDSNFNLLGGRTIATVNRAYYATYDLEATISEEEARQLVQQAHQFYDLTQTYIDGLIRETLLT